MIAVVAPTITNNNAPPAANPKMTKGERMIAMPPPLKLDFRLANYRSLKMKISINGDSFLMLYVGRGLDFAKGDDPGLQSRLLKRK